MSAIEQLGKYEYDKATMLGHGAFAVVYRGWEIGVSVHNHCCFYIFTNQNRLSPYLGFLLYCHKSQSYIPFAITHRISKCLKHIIRKLFKLHYVRT